MVDMLSVVTGLLAAASVAAAGYYVITNFIPLLKETLEDYTGDERTAELLGSFAIVYIGLLTLREIGSAISSMDLFISAIGRIVGPVAGRALSVIQGLQWFIYIAVLIFIGTKISEYVDDE